LVFYFQFPLLGIFPCIFGIKTSVAGNLEKLSIPFTWDFSMHHFSMHQAYNSPPTEVGVLLSIPFTWDFSMHLDGLQCVTSIDNTSFNSLYLGFFHASYAEKEVAGSHEISFNSLYLGFFHASPLTPKAANRLDLLFQFPLLGIFPCIE